MEIIEFIGFAAAGVIGVTLGLIGGGGSILTVPVLVYLMDIDPVLATAYSLFIVGISALIGTLKNAQKGMVSYKTAIVFAIPSFTAVFLTRRFLVPAIPDSLFNVGNTEVTKDLAIMIFFALIMVLASISMIRSKRGGTDETEVAEQKYNYPMIMLEGFVVGTLTGIVGAGGGFLIIPALVLLANLPMKLAVGTSLLIIAVKSLIGFVGDLRPEQTIDWQFLLIFSSLSIAGIFLGTYLTKFISGAKLKRGFGYFVLLMGVFIIVKETVL